MTFSCANYYDITIWTTEQKRDCNVFLGEDDIKDDKHQEINQTKWETQMRNYEKQHKNYLLFGDSN